MLVILISCNVWWYTIGRYAIGDVAAAADDDDHDDDVVVVDSGVLTELLAHVHYLNQVKCVVVHKWPIRDW